MTTGSYSPPLLDLLINSIVPLDISDGTNKQTYLGIEPLNVVINRQFIYVPPPIRVTVGNFNINRIRINATNTTYPRIKISPLPPKS